MSTTLKEYLVTFGQKYRREPHPKVTYADPDGWLSIMAYGYDQAREMAFKELGPAWGMIYERGVDKLNEQYFPLGQLHQIVATTPEEALTPHHSRASGFTVVEVMIVIIILGILSAMAIPALSKVRAEIIRTKILRGETVTKQSRKYLAEYDAARGRPTPSFNVEAANYREGDRILIDGKRHVILRVDDFYVLSRATE